jgi:hypothetical protein
MVSQSLYLVFTISFVKECVAVSAFDFSVNVVHEHICVWTGKPIRGVDALHSPRQICFMPGRSVHQNHIPWSFSHTFGKIHFQFVGTVEEILPLMAFGLVGINEHVESGIFVEDATHPLLIVFDEESMPLMVCSIPDSTVVPESKYKEIARSLPLHDIVDEAHLFSTEDNPSGPPNWWNKFEGACPPV